MLAFKTFRLGITNRFINMNRQAKCHFGVPTKENVDYAKIYEFNSNVITPQELFVPYLKNRGGRIDALTKHIQEIKESILKNGGMDKFPPIIVDINTLMIADGNCRENACIELLNDGLISDITLRVIFEDIPEEEFDDRVIQLNQGQKSWTTVDFIYNYMLRGNDSYKKLIDFCMSEETLHKKDGKINPRYAGAALRLSPKDLTNASMSITEEDVEIGKRVVNEAAEIRKKFSEESKANGGGWYEPYLRAWAEFRDTLGNIAFEDYLKEVSKTLKCRKKEIKVPYGSNRKADWNGFFRSIYSYMI